MTFSFFAQKECRIGRSNKGVPILNSTKMVIVSEYIFSFQRIGKTLYTSSKLKRGGIEDNESGRSRSL